MAGMPARVAGIFTIMLGASLLNRTVCSSSASLLRKLRGSVWMESRPFRPPCFSNAGRSSSAARTDSSSTSFQPIWSSVADGISRMSSAIRGFQVAMKPRIAELIREMPSATEDQIGWKLVEELSVRAAELLRPAFEKHGGRNGRLSIQTDPRNFRNSEALLEQAVRFSKLAPNMIVKIPATRAGIPAIEEASYRGISINATVSFTLPQCVAVAEAVERGLRRREKEGKSVADMGPVCTIMVGRLDDWMKAVAEKEGVLVDPGIFEWAGVAVFKKTYRLFKQRGYRTRLLSAAFRQD